MHRGEMYGGVSWKQSKLKPIRVACSDSIIDMLYTGTRLEKCTELVGFVRYYDILVWQDRKIRSSMR